MDTIYIDLVIPDGLIIAMSILAILRSEVSVFVIPRDNIVWNWVSWPHVVIVGNVLVVLNLLRRDLIYGVVQVFIVIEVPLSFIVVNLVLLKSYWKVVVSLCLRIIVQLFVGLRLLVEAELFGFYVFPKQLSLDLSWIHYWLSLNLDMVFSDLLGLLRKVTNKCFGRWLSLASCVPHLQFGLHNLFIVLWYDLLVYLWDF